VCSHKRNHPTGKPWAFAHASSVCISQAYDQGRPTDESETAALATKRCRVKDKRLAPLHVFRIPVGACVRPSCGEPSRDALRQRRVSFRIMFVGATVASYFASAATSGKHGVKRKDYIVSGLTVNCVGPVRDFNPLITPRMPT